MRISELSRDTGLPLATVKFYLREGLLPPGRATAATQAEYDETHVRRLRLVKALTDVGRLPLATVRAVLAAVDAGPRAGLAAIGTAHDALPPTATRGAPPGRALALMDTLGWSVAPGSSTLDGLEAALDTLDALGLPTDGRTLARYARAALDVATWDIDQVPDGEVADQVEFVVAGTVLYEPVLLALRRLAQQHVFVSRAEQGAGTAKAPDPGGVEGLPM